SGEVWARPINASGRHRILKVQSERVYPCRHPYPTMRHWLPENSAWKALVSLLFWTTVAYAANTDETATAAETVISGKIDGYRGIWFDLGQKSEFGSKYSGGLGTYTAKHHPLAVYAPEVNKTFFVYGGTPAADQRRLLAMASY